MSASRGLAAICLVFLLPIGAASADWAIAFGQGTSGGWSAGFSIGASDPDTAAINALTECSKRGRNCQIRAKNNVVPCGALATTAVGNGSGYGKGDTKKAAERQALASCKEANPKNRCKVRKSFCDGSISVDETDNEPSDVPTAEFVGSYAGQGEGLLNLDISRADGETYDVTMRTMVPGHCSGVVEGQGRALNGVLLVLSRKQGEDGKWCSLTIKPNAIGATVSEEGGCIAFHGAACGFDGELLKLPSR